MTEEGLMKSSGFRFSLSELRMYPTDWYHIVWYYQFTRSGEEGSDIDGLEEDCKRCNISPIVD